MLHMTDVSKVYRTAMIETHALRDLTLEVRDGEFVAVTGPSGSGKTTFLNIAGLLEELTGGAYLLDGVDVRKLDDRARSRLRNEKIGFARGKAARWRRRSSSSRSEETPCTSSPSSPPSAVTGPRPR